MMDLDESGLLADTQLEQNLQRLREEERLLLEKQAAMEAGGIDDIAALENQDALRLNHLQQQELQKRLQVQAQRLARQQAQGQNQEGCTSARGRDCPEIRELCELREGRELREGPRRRANCTVRVNNLHAASAADAIETDV
ncbi:unnamed protein product [Parnassius mnemosyne]|uniref:Uncharacterized protein n=1 Tax=Parnassius mnemosyne TaxID=213953 RepID=A0AAV1KY46_9NEOP